MIAMLVDRGLIAYEDKVSKYWPEFSKGLKENVTIADLVQHSAGLVYFDSPLAMNQVTDFDLIAKVCSFLAKKFNNIY